MELLGETNRIERLELRRSLYDATAAFFRAIRLGEIVKQGQRSTTGESTYTTEDLADDVWGALDDTDRGTMATWLSGLSYKGRPVYVPEEGRVTLLPASDMFDANVVFIGEGRDATKVAANSRGEAELIALLAQSGFRGDIDIPGNEEECDRLRLLIQNRLDEFSKHAESLVDQRVASDGPRAQVLGLLRRWHLYGRERSSRNE